MKAFSLSNALPGEEWPIPTTPFRAHIAAVHDRLRARGVDPTQLPDPVEELIKAWDAAGWE